MFRYKQIIVLRILIWNIFLILISLIFVNLLVKTDWIKSQVIHPSSIRKNSTNGMWAITRKVRMFGRQLMVKDWENWSWRSLLQPFILWFQNTHSLKKCNAKGFITIIFILCFVLLFLLTCIFTFSQQITDEEFLSFPSPSKSTSSKVYKRLPTKPRRQGSRDESGTRNKWRRERKQAASEKKRQETNSRW